jgi:hypothetical protein
MNKIKYGDWNYIAELPLKFNNGLKIEFKEEIPNDLYKYYSSSERNFNSIINNTFFCTHPFQFNDLTDSTPLSYDFKDLTFEEYKKIYEELITDKLITEEQLLIMYENDKLNNFINYCNFYFSLLTQKTGFICLTQNEMHNLMWAHYAGDSGFKVKFNTKKFIDSINKINNQDCLLFPINYVKHKLHIEANKYGIYLPFLVDISTKVYDWKYENEWRILITKNDMLIPKSLISTEEDYHGKDNRFVEYNPECIEEIVLGFNFFNGKHFAQPKTKINNEITIETKTIEVKNFLKFICDKLNGKVLKAGILVDDEEPSFPNTKTLKRSVEELKIVHISENIFSILRNNKENIMKY